MPSLFAAIFAGAVASIGVSAQVPPRCALVAMADSIDARCNAEHWSVVALVAGGDEAVVWQGSGPGSVRLPASAGVRYRLVVDY